MILSIARRRRVDGRLWIVVGAVRLTAQAVAPTGWSPGMPKKGWVLVIGVVLLLAGFAGYLVGTRSDVSILSGSPIAGEHVISIEANGWWYSIPEDVPWQDAQGGWNLGSRPSCIPPMSFQNPPITFGAVSAAWPDGSQSRTVVWVRCP